MKSVHKLAIAVVLLHLAISIPHGMAHSNLHIQMQLWQNVYIWVIIMILPLVAAVLIWRRRRRAGFLLLLLSMGGALLFGLYYHFIAAGPDNVASLPAHAASGTFQLTAVLLALMEAAGLVLGILGCSPVYLRRIIS